ncbi:MAG: SMC-Scp complex subunit ScpB [Planctomycetaceae bacterium]|jgi:segregation and condensation protein B|nr:SMC-Scp complex subunit ScpB [Planctomycetaceae bacterium]
MSAKKIGKKNFASTDNADSSDNSNNSIDIIVTENTDKVTDVGATLPMSDSVVSSCNKLGAKYYVEDIVSEEDEAIFSLASLRDMFISVKSRASDQNTIATVKMPNSSDQKDVANTFNNTKSDINNSNKSASIFVDDEMVSDKEDVVVVLSGVVEDADGSEDKEDKEDAEFDQDGVSEQMFLDVEGGGITVPVSPESIFEAMLFVGDRDNKPLLAEHVAGKMRNVQPYEIDEVVLSLNRKYDLAGSPYKIIEDGGGYRMVLRDEFNSIQEKFYGKIREARLSQGAIDTLAIIAYKQPITAEEIQMLRKQPSNALLAQLVRRGLIQIESETKNKKKKILYKTTQRFLKLFQLDSITDLPVTDDFDFR